MGCSLGCKLTIVRYYLVGYEGEKTTIGNGALKHNIH